MMEVVDGTAYGNYYQLIQTKQLCDFNAAANLENIF